MNNRPTPETDQIEKYDGFKIKDSVTTCGDESSSVYINVIHARHLERERDEARDIADELASIAAHCLGWHDHKSSDTAIKIAAALKRWKKSKIPNEQD